MVSGRFYSTGRFARRASVSVRTLRFYDRVGLLTPSARTEAGYRMYTDEDFPRLQHVPHSSSSASRWMRSDAASQPDRGGCGSHLVGRRR
jgi:hypothetical protein